MYYLVKIGSENKIIEQCEESSHKYVIFNNYCRKNDIIKVKNRQEINDTCKKDGIYTYKISENKYIVLQCIYHSQGYVINEYVEKHNLYKLNFIYFFSKKNNIKYLLKDIIISGKI